MSDWRPVVSIPGSFFDTPQIKIDPALTALCTGETQRIMALEAEIARLNDHIERLTLDLALKETDFRGPA